MARPLLSNFRFPHLSPRRSLVSFILSTLLQHIHPSPSFAIILTMTAAVSLPAAEDAPAVVRISAPAGLGAGT
jgi:hypothetical protein